MLALVSAALEVSWPTRPLCVEDAGSVCALVRTCEEADAGEAMLDLADIEAHWRQPSLELATQSIGVFADGELIACSEVAPGRRAETYVHPRHRGRGIGTALMHWTWETAAACGGTLVGQSVPEPSTSAALLRNHGYRPLWTSWVLELPSEAVVPAPRLPARVQLRPHRPGLDERAAYQVVEDAFNEWPDRDPTRFEDWAATVLNRPGFEPWHLLLAVANARDVVGVASLMLSGGSVFVAQLAVRRDWRGLGLGRALLQQAFESGRHHGARRAELSTDSRTGALDLYLRVGMRVTHTFVHPAKTLPGLA